MGRRGPTFAWARRATRALDTSLRELAQYIYKRPELDRVVAICADTRLATPKQSAQLARIVSRYGFEGTKDRRIGRPGLIRRIGENILMALLVLATNPVVLHSTVLCRGHMRVTISRARLLRRYNLHERLRSQRADAQLT